MKIYFLKLVWSIQKNQKKKFPAYVQVEWEIYDEGHSITKFQDFKILPYGNKFKF